jgi:outer membrane protein OmpA-like peptidoglycan-associated protein
VPVTVAAVGLAALGVVQVLPTRDAVQSQLADRSTRALSAAGLSDARVRFDGRDATVLVRSPGDRDRALAIVRSQQGVRVARVIVDRTATGAGQSPSSRPTGSTKASGPSGKSGPGSTPSRSVGSSPPRAPSASASASATGQSAIPSASPGPTVAPGPSMPPIPSATNGSTPPSGAPAAPAASPPTILPPSTEPPPAGVSRSATPPATTGESIPRVQTAVDTLGPIQFASASAALTPAGRKLVAGVAAILRSDGSVNVEIQGFTDTVGPATTNLALSRMRARTVYDTLRVLGIPAGRMTATGYGESHPRMPNDSGANRAANRRVTFVIRANAPR